MKQLLLQWRKLQGKYQTLPRRQKMLLAASLIVVPYFLVSTFGLDPFLMRSRKLEREIEGYRSQAGSLTNQLQTLQMQLADDPDAAQKKRIGALEQEAEQLDKQFQELGSTLIPPTEVLGFLESVLVKSPTLRLLSLKTLPPASIMPPPANKEGAATPGFDMYRHGVEIRLEGNFTELLRYVEQLEKSQKKILWGAFRLQAGDYPFSTMTLTVYTLSTDKTWISL